MARAKDIEKELYAAFGGRSAYLKAMSGMTDQQRQALKDSVVNAVRGGTPEGAKKQDVNPDVKVNTQQYSPAEKQALWEKSGGKGAYQEDAFFRGADGSLSIKPNIIPGVGETIQDNRFLAANARPEGIFRPVGDAAPFDEISARQAAEAANKTYFDRKNTELGQDYTRNTGDLNRLKAYATSTYAAELVKNNRSFATQMRQASNAYGARGLSGSGVFAQYATEAAQDQESVLSKNQAAQEKALADYASQSGKLSEQYERDKGDLSRQQQTQVASDVQKSKDSAAQAYYNQLLLGDKSPNLTGKPQGVFQPGVTPSAAVKVATYNNQDPTMGAYEQAMAAVRAASKPRLTNP